MQEVSTFGWILIFEMGAMIVNSFGIWVFIKIRNWQINQRNMLFVSLPGFSSHHR